MTASSLKSDAQPNDLAALFAAVEKIGSRLNKLEDSFRNQQVPDSRSEGSNIQAAHPSLDKLNIAEALADSIFGHYNKEKACQFEPDKPCDHCSMCNSRGF